MKRFAIALLVLFLATPLLAAPKQQQFTGIVEVQAPGIQMEGTHQLVDANKHRIALLKSDKVDLGKYVGQLVRISGDVTTTTEGNDKLVNVAWVRPLGRPTPTPTP